ncbi:elongation factor G [Turicimonas muris]|uniref:Elongation factor G n=3 Tax=Turicimonas muris TaxID=1796652 RepID=A0A227KDY2_9BURK|nr:elongation factor G [Turicimonas muris]ANU66518.1 elongation factor G [Burkholderiales bacterium YL45]MBS4767582.1 elongation factor G [Burkholderiales bacterium]MBS4845671.1 elongation factor G [Burkholderiales bacterium]OXE45649.1 elongation factor G [Turicimonas muris]QQQ97666.1 elongation factor G [Turicimonas muris]
MPIFSTENLRTVALLGHGGSGKTTLAEGILAKSGMIITCGSVERGTTVCDSDPLEKAVQHSLRAACTHFEADKEDGTEVRVHMIDTPGYPDFVGQALGSLDAVKTAAIVVDATAGIQLMTRRMMDWAKERNLNRILIVNKIDAEHVDLPKLIEELKEAFGNEVMPINLPANNGARVIDCFAKDHGEADFLSVEEVHRQFIEQVVEVDDEAMEKYLEEGNADPSTLHGPLTQALREGHIIPICFVSGKTGAGVDDLINVMVRHLPNPAESNDPLFTDAEGNDIKLIPDPELPLVAHVFKVVNDPYIGKVGVFRIHQGTMRRDDLLFVGDNKKAIKVSHPMILQGKETTEVRELVPGDIGVISKIDELVFDSVIHASHDHDNIRMKPLSFPKPMYGLAIAPARRGDEGRLSDILNKMLSEDPTLELEHDTTLNETVLRGISAQHLKSVLERMAAQFKLEVNTRTPRIPYRETIAQGAEGHARHKKQTGGAGQFGEVYLRIEPKERGTGFEFVDEVKGGAIPYNFIPAVEKGVREALTSGYVAGYPVHDVRVVVYDGKSHPVDSKEVAFVSAGRKAMLDAIAKAKPTLLEPIVDIEIVAPDSAIGDITGDLASRRGQVTGTANMAGGMMIISGVVPLAELDGYAARLNAITQGAGSYSMELSGYAPVPVQKQMELAANFQRKDEDD